MNEDIVKAFGQHPRLEKSVQHLLSQACPSDVDMRPRRIQTSSVHYIDRSRALLQSEITYMRTSAERMQELQNRKWEQVSSLFKLSARSVMWQKGLMNYWMAPNLMKARS